MKGVILAGGLGTRLYPLTTVTNKHLLPVYDRPMIFYPIQTLVRAGISEILVVTGGPHAGHFLAVLKNGKELGIKHLEYAFQETPDGGIADALAIAEEFADKGPVTVILGDNTTDADIGPPVRQFKDGALIFLRRVPDPHRFGVAMIDAQNPAKILRIVEKPENPDSDLAAIGIYVYDHQVFDIIRRLVPSWRNQLEITDVNNAYIELGQLHWTMLEGFYSDAGTFDSLYESNRFWAERHA